MTREADIEAMARALYEDWIAEDWPCEYCSWEQLPDKQTWLGRAQAAYAIVSKRIKGLEGDWFDKAIRDHCDEHGPSGGAWNISMVLERLHRARSTLSDKGTASDVG